jgi:hypothetical protein
LININELHKNRKIYLNRKVENIPGAFQFVVSAAAFPLGIQGAGWKKRQIEMHLISLIEFFSTSFINIRFGTVK